MTNSLDKENIFNFFKAQSFIQEIGSSSIEIEEKSKNAKLKKVTLRSLNSSSKYWLVDTESNAFQLQGRKVENIVLEHTSDNILNIIMIELKSENIGNQNKILEKFKNSLSLIYILLNLLDGKNNQKINVFGILIAQEDKKWNEKSTLNILSSTSIRYKKKSFYTKSSETIISIDKLLI